MSARLEQAPVCREQLIEFELEQPTELALETPALGRHHLDPHRPDDGRLGKSDEGHQEPREKIVVAVVAVVLDRVACDEKPRAPLQQERRFWLLQPFEAEELCVRERECSRCIERERG